MANSDRLDQLIGRVAAKQKPLRGQWWDGFSAEKADWYGPDATGTGYENHPDRHIRRWLNRWPPGQGPEAEKLWYPCGSKIPQRGKPY